MSAITIKDVQVITTQPDTQRLVIVKVITSEPGLYGLGRAPFPQRFHPAVAAIEQPAPISGKIMCCESLPTISADSAIKCTPQKTIYSASV